MCIVFFASAQRMDDPDELKVLARSYLDSITLRWAPMKLDSWIKGNQFGYAIERYTMIRESKVLSKPEKKILTTTLLKPRPLDQWEALVKRNKYAAIAAQALYGESFQLTTQGTDVFQIVNKVKENEQRFSFALFAADLSAEVSAFLGLRFTDKEVKEGEKYLYRVVCVTHANDTLRGSVFVGPEEYLPPVPIDFTAEFKGNVVAMKWNQSYYKGVYNAFIIERSSNGKDFKPLSPDPIVTLSEHDKEESRYQYATDSLPDQTTDYYYRVRGLTPFGEQGPPSEAVKGRGSSLSDETPHIINGASENNRTIKIGWEFPIEHEKGLKGFMLKRSESPKQPFIEINTTLIRNEERMYEDTNPKQTNYYQVIAVSSAGKEFKSPVYYAQLTDSIPPSAPKGLKGKVTETGKITISWSGNTEPDIYGYRIYRGNYRKEEFSQLTREPIPNTTFTDSISLNTLNKKIHYQVMAIDRNQNYSALSEVLSLELPDKVKPVAPVFFPPVSSHEGVSLQWTPSSSDDVVHYDVYRKEGQLWRKIFSHLSSTDTIYSYLDTEITEGQLSAYTVVAVDQSGNESDPAAPIKGTKLIDVVKPAVSLREPAVDRTNKKIVLKWNYEQKGVNRYQIYRSKDDQPLKLYSTIAASAPSFEDKQLNMNSIYTYRILALFANGAKSELSKELKVRY